MGLATNLPFDQFGVMFLGDTGPSDPELTGDPCIFQVGGVAYFRDAAGVKYPLVPGAGGAGVVVVEFADSPYTALQTDRVFLVDTSGGAVTVNLYPTPADGQPAQFVDSARSFATNALTVSGNGHNINAATTLVVSEADACPLLIYGGTTWETTAGVATASVKTITFAMSPYQVLPTDEVLLLDTTGGAINVTLEASPAVGRKPIQIADVLGIFSTNGASIDGNGNFIQGASTLSLSQRFGGAIIYWNGTRWAYNRSIYAASDSVDGRAMQRGAYRFLCSLGRNGAGALTLTGAKVGDYVEGIANTTDSATLLPGVAFELTITVADQIQQLSAVDLSAKTLTFLLVAKS